MSNAPRNTATRDQHRAAIKRHRPPCGICEGEIDYTLRSPDPMSFEVDHIIPLAKGGLDELANKQAAHRRPKLQSHQVGLAGKRQHASHVRHLALMVTPGARPPSTSRAPLLLA